MKLIAIFLLSILAQTLFAQIADSSNKYNDPSIWGAIPFSLPIFKDGGEPGLQKFIQKNLRYPKTRDCIEGRVYVDFTIDTLGNVKDIKINRGITSAADEEAIRVVKMLTFIPGTRDGKPIEMGMTLPISFRFD